MEWGNNQVNISSSKYYKYFNTSSTVYVLAVIGIDAILPFTRTFTESTTYTIPVTGKYNLELYGGGGAIKNGDLNYNKYSQCKMQGRSSCQQYNSITLTKGDIMAVTIGKGGSSQARAKTIDGETTSFGTYSVEGGKGTKANSPRSGAGNRGLDGLWQDHVVVDGLYYNKTLGTLLDYGNRGYGYINSSSMNYQDGKDGAVYLQFLGES